MQSKTVTIVDPPVGWKYGFPCELPEGKKYEELLKEHGYPSDMFDLAIRHSRFWNEERKEKETPASKGIQVSC